MSHADKTAGGSWSRVLATLRNAREPLEVWQISYRCLLSESTTRRALKALEANGNIENLPRRRDQMASSWQIKEDA